MDTAGDRAHKKRAPRRPSRGSNGEPLALKPCAYSKCKRPFIPKMNSQLCCTREHQQKHWREENPRKAR